MVVSELFKVADGLFKADWAALRSLVKENISAVVAVTAAAIVAITTIVFPAWLVLEQQRLLSDGTPSSAFDPDRPQRYARTAASPLDAHERCALLVSESAQFAWALEHLKTRPAGDSHFLQHIRQATHTKSGAMTKAGEALALRNRFDAEIQRVQQSQRRLRRLTVVDVEQAVFLSRVGGGVGVAACAAASYFLAVSPLVAVWPAAVAADLAIYSVRWLRGSRAASQAAAARFDSLQIGSDIASDLVHNFTSTSTWAGSLHEDFQHEHKALLRLKAQREEFEAKERLAAVKERMAREEREAAERERRAAREAREREAREIREAADRDQRARELRESETQAAEAERKHQLELKKQELTQRTEAEEADRVSREAIAAQKLHAQQVQLEADRDAATLRTNRLVALGLVALCVCTMAIWKKGSTALSDPPSVKRLSANIAGTL